jgi:hypothetical protein
VDHSANSGPTFNIDETAAEFLYGGSISQKGGDELYSGLRVLGAVNNTATQLMIVQDHAFYTFTTTPATPFWGTQATGGYNGNAAGGVLMSLMIKSRENGIDIDNKKIRVQARHWGDSYDFFNVTLGEGVSVAAIGTTPDAQNNTAQGTVTTYTHVVNSAGTANDPLGGYQTIDLNNTNGAQPYYSKWTYGADTSGDGLKGIWEYVKDLTGNGTAKTLDTIGGELFLGITHSWAYNNESGNFTERETVVWGTEITYDGLLSGPFTPGNYVTIGTNGAAGRVMYDDAATQLIVALDDTSITILTDDVITEFEGPTGAATTTTADVNVTIVNNDKSGGSGVLLAYNDGGVTGDMYIQLVTGVAPVTALEVTGVTSAQTADVNGAPASKTIPKIFLGSYTGSLIGAYGIGIDSGDIVATDSIEDLLGVTQTPPNNVTFTVSGVVSGEDRVLVAPRTGVVILTAQLTLLTALVGAAESAVVTTVAIPTDTPTSGTIRVVNDSGYAIYLPYTSFTGSTFTLTSPYNFSGVDEFDSATGTDVYITYIDKLAGAAQETFTVVYLADRDLFVRVRDGGGTPIKTFESSTAALTSTGGSVGVIRTSDA